MAFPRGRTGPATVRLEPRISVNKLGEYLVAAASRRRRIILDQKYPPTYQVIRYREAEQAIVDQLVNGHTDPGILARHLKRLNEWKPGPGATESQIQRVRVCREAIQSFMAIDPQLLPPPSLVLSAGPREARKLTKAGVSISVRPEIISAGIGRDTARTVGAVKLHISKSHELDDRAGEYVGAMLQEFAEHHLSHWGHAAFRQFHVIDVFARRVHSAPRAFVRRRSDVEAACEEIAILWRSL